MSDPIRLLESALAHQAALDALRRERDFWKEQAEKGWAKVTELTLKAEALDRRLVAAVTAWRRYCNGNTQTEGENELIVAIYGENCTTRAKGG